MKHICYSLFAALVLLAFQSCTDKLDETLKHYTEEEYQILTNYLNLPQNTHDYSIVTNIPLNRDKDLPFHKATLGRVLFYDKMLSKDESTSCASCHKQEIAFADDKQLSEGIEGKIGKRNSLPLGNTIGFVKYYGTDLTIPSGQFSWDESKPSIGEQSKAAIESPFEMGHDMWTLVEKINQQDYYQVLFKKVYGNEGATEANIMDALSEFVNSFSSRESLFDKAIADAGGTPYEPFALFNASENRGKELFAAHCGNCHDPNHNAIIMASANNGLDLNYTDKGVGSQKGDPNYDGVFKVPSLRNIELTGPYMHDGRFQTLEEVVDHYNDNIQNHKNLSSFLKNGNQPKRLNLSSSDRKALVDYLKTLTDHAFVTAEKYSDPFKF